MDEDEPALSPTAPTVEEFTEPQEEPEEPEGSEGPESPIPDPEPQPPGKDTLDDEIPCAQPPPDDPFWGLSHNRFTSLAGPIVAPVTPEECRHYQTRVSLEEWAPKDRVDREAEEEPRIYQLVRPWSNDWLMKEFYASQPTTRKDETAFHYLDEPCNPRPVKRNRKE